LDVTSWFLLKPSRRSPRDSYRKLLRSLQVPPQDAARGVIKAMNLSGL